MDTSKQQAIERILQVAAKKGSKFVLLSTATLAVATSYPGLELPSSIGFLAGVGVEALGSILTDLASRKEISDEQIWARLEKAIPDEGAIATRKDLSNAVEHLLRHFSASSNREKEAIEILANIQFQIEGASTNTILLAFSDKLEKLQESVDELRAIKLKEDPEDVSLSIRPDDIRSTEESTDKLEERHSIHLKKATQLILEMTDTTKRYNRQIDKLLGHISRISSKKAFPKVELMVLYRSWANTKLTYASEIEKLLPNYGKEHALGMDDYILLTTFYFTSPDTKQKSKVRSRLELIRGFYKPKLSIAYEISKLFHESNSIPKEFKVLLDKATIKKFYVSGDRLNNANKLKSQIFEKAVEHVNEIEIVSESLVGYLNFREYQD